MSGMVGLPPRYIDKIEVVGGCWVWTANRNARGYGLVYVGPTRSTRPLRLARRQVFEILVRPLAPGEVLHHRCGVRLCVNPDHLSPMTRAAHARLHPDNALGWQEEMRARTHCLKRGHEMTPENTYLKRTRWNTIRVCRECRRIDGTEHQRLYRARRRAETFQG